MIFLSDRETLLGVVVGLVGLVVVVVSLGVVPEDRRPSSATAWIITIAFVPIIGLAAFLAIGSPKLPADRREKQRNVDRLITERTRQFAPWKDDEEGPPWLEQVVSLNRSLGAMPMLRGNDAHVVTDYEGSFAGMVADIDAAREYVHVEFYILNLDPTTAPVFEAMERAVARGVTVRVLLDHVGSWGYPGYRRTLAELDRIGVQWHRMLPVLPFRRRYQRPDLRNHRKLVVVDARTAWVGSINLIERSYRRRRNRRRGRQWQDLMVRLRGPVVQEVDALFATDWFSETDEMLEVAPPEEQDGREGVLDCQVVPSGPGFDTENNLRLFNALLYGARHRVSITSPYFVPDESLLYAVTSAAYRGVDVELFVPEQADQTIVHHAQRSYYEQLLRSGVRIHLYPQPFVLHAKHMSVDDTIAAVGSSNMDMRSFSLDMEATLLVEGRTFTDELRAVEDRYRVTSRELLLEDWVRRPRRQRFLDNVCRLTSALQ